MLETTVGRTQSTGLETEEARERGHLCQECSRLPDSSCTSSWAALMARSSGPAERRTSPTAPLLHLSHSSFRYLSHTPKLSPQDSPLMFAAASRSARPLTTRPATVASRVLERSAHLRRAASSFSAAPRAKPEPVTRAEVVSSVPRAVKLIGAGAIIAAFGLGLSIGKTAGAEGAGSTSASGNSSIRPTSPYALRLKAAAEAYPPAFGSTDDFLAGIDELRALFDRQGRPDDVSVDDADLESHGISASLELISRPSFAQV